MNGEVRKRLLVSGGDLKWPKPHGSTVWPVLLTLHFTTLLYVGYHDDSGGILLPDQTPETYQGLSLGT